LQESGELYVDLDRPHSGALNNSLYFIDSLSGLKRIVAQETFREVCICIFREKQYTIRGVAEDTLLATALAQIPDHQYFSILSSEKDALGTCDVIGWGDSHDELRGEVIRLKGRLIRLGQNPFDQAWTKFFERPDEVWVGRFSANLEHRQPFVSKNRIEYSRFDGEPARYRDHIDFW
jgi:hypothetical protein